MKNKKRNFLIIVTAFLLVGCSQDGNHLAKQGEVIENNQEQPVIDDKRDEHITRTLTDNLEIDADILYPSKEEIATYSVKRKVFNKDVINLFEGDTEYTSEDNPNYENSFTLNTSGGGYLSVSEGYLFYTKNQEYDDVVSMIEELFMKGNQFNEVKELSFCNQTEAIALGIKKIKEISEGSPEVIRMVAMEHGDLEKLQKGLLNEESYQAGIKNGKTDKIDNFSDDDDVYFIEYAIKQNDIFLYHGITEPQISMSIDAFWDFSVNVVMLVGNDGIRYLNFRNVFETPLVEIKKEPIISVEDALKNVKETYDNVILTEPIIISKVWLEYIPVPDWENLMQIELRPYWCIKIDSVDEEGKVWSNAERINALTGGNLSYGK